MRIHKREQQVDLAQTEIVRAVLKALEFEDLTPWEEVRVLTGAFSTLLGQHAKLGIRMERHGTYNKEGGLA